jgi:predicted ATPase
MRRIVLTGGPGAGKTAVLDIVRRSLCAHLVVLPESAGIVFSGGFPRDDRIGSRKAAQRVIFFIQRELENIADLDQPAIVLCDRGTVDGQAYWPGPGTLWAAMRTTRDAQFARYDTVIHLRVPSLSAGYHGDALRHESAAAAAEIDERIAIAWADHPHRFTIASTESFATKAARTLEILRSELPAACQGHLEQSVELERRSRADVPRLPKSHSRRKEGVTWTSSTGG